MPPVSAASSTKALNAILPLIAAGQPYEAHQKARTFASRYQKSGQYDTAIDVLFQSARELLKTGQQGSGTDLTLFLLDVYDTKGEEVTDESRGKEPVVVPPRRCRSMRLTSVLPYFPGRLTQLIALTGSSGSWRKSIIDKAAAYVAYFCPSYVRRPLMIVARCRWSAKHGPCPAGDPGLQHYIGELLYKGSRE